MSRKRIYEKMERDKNLADETEIQERERKKTKPKKKKRKEKLTKVGMRKIDI